MIKNKIIQFPSIIDMTLNKIGLVYDLYTLILSLKTRSNFSKFNSCLNELML